MPATRDPVELARGPWTDLIEVVPVCKPFPESLRASGSEPIGGCWREVLLETDSLWTAYSCNQGARVEHSVFGHLCERLKCRGLTVTCIPHTVNGKGREARGRYGNTEFNLFSPEPTGLTYQLLRTLQVLVDDNDKWVFFGIGPIQPFEQPERYKARRVKDRFTPQLLEEYCAALGVRYFDESFYRSRGYVIYERRDEPENAG